MRGDVTGEDGDDRDMRGLGAVHTIRGGRVELPAAATDTCLGVTDDTSMTSSAGGLSCDMGRTPPASSASAFTASGLDAAGGLFQSRGGDVSMETEVT